MLLGTLSENIQPRSAGSLTMLLLFVRYLREQLAVPEAKLATRIIPDAPPKDGIFVVDTAEMFAALEGHSGERRNLERMCRLLGLRDLEYMHNAGNDAHVRYDSFSLYFINRGSF